MGPEVRGAVLTLSPRAPEPAGGISPAYITNIICCRTLQPRWRLNILITGFPAGAAKEAADKVRRLLQQVDFQRPPVLKKAFRKKFPNIPSREDYSGVFEEEFWQNFTITILKKLGEFHIDPLSLIKL